MISIVSAKITEKIKSNIQFFKKLIKQLLFITFITFTTIIGIFSPIEN